MRKLGGASSKSPVAARTARWGQRCCPNICSKSFTPHSITSPLQGQGPPPRVLTGLESPSPSRGGPSTDQMSREEIRVTASSQPNCPKETGASHLKWVVNLAGLGKRVSTVSALSHVCNCGLGRPLPSTPLPRQWRRRRLSAFPPLPSVRPASLSTDWLYRPEESQGSLQQQRNAPASGLKAKPEVAPRDTFNPVLLAKYYPFLHVTPAPLANYTSQQAPRQNPGPSQSPERHDGSFPTAGAGRRWPPWKPLSKFFYVGVWFCPGAQLNGYSSGTAFPALIIPGEISAAL